MHVLLRVSTQLSNILHTGKKHINQCNRPDHPLARNPVCKVGRVSSLSVRNNVFLNGVSNVFYNANYYVYQVFVFAFLGSFCSM